MKMKRLISLAIVLLLVCGMPVSAFADDIVVGKGETVQNGDSQIIDVNNGIVERNSGTVQTNNGTVQNNAGPSNDGINVGIVETNTSNGTVETNAGIVGKTDENNEVVDSSGNYGTIKINEKTGSVLINQETGVVEKNYGTIDENKGTVGIVYSYDPETGASNFGAQSGNFGTIDTNEGTVTYNGGYDGKSSCTGNIITNVQGGVVWENYYGSSIENNLGTVVINEGTVTNKEGGEINYNLGKVVNEEGGKLHEFIGEDIQLITAAGTYYGICIWEGYLFEDEDTVIDCSDAVLLQRQDGDTVDLATLFQQDGYEVTGYYHYYFDSFNEDYVSGTTYAVSGPSVLTLVWSKIKAAISSSGPAADVPTAVSAEYVRVGTTVQAKGQIFKVIEMDDGSITVVTLIKLSEEDKDDLMAYLGKYLTPQQLELLLSEPELVSTELADELFGGDTNHVVFKAAKNLFEK